MFGVGVITDIVGSRDLSDRAAGQAAIRACFEEAHRTVPAAVPLWATAGDEFQSVYGTIEQAIDVTTLVRTLLADDIDCRFGLGKGEIRDIERTSHGYVVQDGPAWWNARQAITIVHRMQSHGQPYLRTWFVGDKEEPQELVNAYLAGRDHVVSRMKVRERRLAAAYLAGRSQDDIARSERISQSAVSQALQRSGATALALGMELFRQGASPTSATQAANTR